MHQNFASLFNCHLFSLKKPARTAMSSSLVFNVLVLQPVRRTGVTLPSVPLDPMPVTGICLTRSDDKLDEETCDRHFRVGVEPERQFAQRPLSCCSMLANLNVVMHTCKLQLPCADSAVAALGNIDTENPNDQQLSSFGLICCG